MNANKLSISQISNSSEEEKLVFNQRKEIIEKLVSSLAKNNSEIYYSPTIEISELIRIEIENCELINQDQKAIVEDLDVHDIQVLLSYPERIIK